MLDNEKCEIVGVCDSYEDRTKKAQDIVKEKQGNVPFGSQDYMDIVKHPDVELVVITVAR